jgi:hypothetical protein
MMPKNSYFLIEKNNSVDLSVSVNTYLESGWQLYGQPIIIATGGSNPPLLYAQAMICDEE